MSEMQPTFRPAAEQKRILLIEDEMINQEILKMYLADTYDVAVAGTGKDALEIIRAQCERISLILLDLNLPDIHGLDILRQVKADTRSARLPVIVMTSDSESEVECLSLGASDFIPKPYPRQQVVLARILRTIELYEDRDTLRWTERDQLTGLYNKEFFYRYAAQLDANHPDEPTDAIVLNINHFHIINDRYGKLYGDEVLKQVAGKALEIVERRGGIASRSEADTFLIYCPHVMDYDAFFETVSGNLNQDGSRARLRMGAYANADKALDIERRFDRAKLAADRVKNSVTNVIGLYDSSMHEEELLSEQLIEDFPTAIREHQFQVYYQPKFDVRPSEPVLASAEALVRWQHPKLGMVSPGVFIPLFENNGLIQTLDQYVWCEAAKQVRDWKERLGIPLPVSVNVSRIDLYDPLLVDKLEEIVRQNGLSNEDLLLEITESAYTENSDQIISTVKTLQKLGFRIEMDDFGSGYSSLNMLSALPIDALKLDMSFVRNAFRERKDTRLLEVMILLAESFGVTTIAEGVETAEQMFTLKMMGCDIIQGYYFSKPLPAKEFEVFLVEKKEHE
jgi:EAL domain-containing protein (putative c-di-GMP-specific phosphodiesterase class I)/FixJ family two-component response regulator